MSQLILRFQFFMDALSDHHDVLIIIGSFAIALAILSYFLSLLNVGNDKALSRRWIGVQ